MNLLRNVAQKMKSLALPAALAAASMWGFSCKYHDAPRMTEDRVFAGGVEVDAHTLNDGHDAYMLYCYACHGEKGDGHGPSSYGLRPSPRDFTKALFKFARIRSSDELPNDEDLIRIVNGGLHGTAMLAWDDIPLVELTKIIQYIKTFGPEKADENGVMHVQSKWEKKKRNGDPVAVLDPFELPDDPWAGKEQAAIEEGRRLYHFRAECLNCHPAYGTKDELYKLSVQAAKDKPKVYKPMTGFRDDPYGSVAKDSAEYNQRILPPDFTFIQLRSVRPGHEMEDLYRIISYGVYPIMPAWKGAGLSEDDIWALAHYVMSLAEIRGTHEALELKTRYQAQAPFDAPKQVEEKPVVQEEKKDDAADAGAPGSAGTDGGAVKKNEKKKNPR